MNQGYCRFQVAFADMKERVPHRIRSRARIKRIRYAPYIRGEYSFQGFSLVTNDIFFEFKMGLYRSPGAASFRGVRRLQSFCVRSGVWNIQIPLPTTTTPDDIPWKQIAIRVSHPRIQSFVVPAEFIRD